MGFMTHGREEEASSFFFMADLLLGEKILALQGFFFCRLLLRLVHLTFKSTEYINVKIEPEDPILHSFLLP